MGGVIYRLHWQLDAETTYWLRADGSTPPLILGPVFVASIDGRPTAVDLVMQPDEGVDRDLRLMDLQSGDERRISGSFCDGDGWQFPTSYGGGLFVGVAGSAVGCGYSDTSVVFWDDNGVQIDHPHNPATEPCGPCELSAAISPDGRMLAFVYRADSPSEYHGRVECGPEGAELEDWWESTQDTPGRLVVVDLESGSTMFDTTTTAQTIVSSFDGRYLAVETARWSWSPDDPRSIIYDTLGEQPPIHIEGRVALIQEPVGT